MLSRREAARLIDISAVRTHHTLADLQEIKALAEQYHFINVHALPAWVKTLARLVGDLDDVYVGSPVGFPSGGHRTEIKLLEAEQLIADGVQEMDIVMNVGRLRNREYDYVLNDIKSVVDFAAGRVLTKVIIEINCLSDDEVKQACELVMKSGADFVKTGTGWVPGDANLERARMIKEFCGKDIKLKVAGGIRSKEDFLALVELGVERMGINTQSAVDIVRALDA